MACLFALSAFALAILLHGLVMRVPLRLDSVMRFLLVGVPLGIVLTALLLVQFGLTIPSFAAMLLYALLCELYMFCFTLVLSSVSATLLIMLRDGPAKTSDLASVYDPDEMVRLRLERLLNNGFVEQVNGGLRVSAKGLQYHRAFTSLRTFFGHRQEQ